MTADFSPPRSLPTKSQFLRLCQAQHKRKNWLEQSSLAQIFDWFDCVETTSVKTDAGTHYWTTESVARDRLFLKSLGVTESCSN